MKKLFVNIFLLSIGLGCNKEDVDIRQNYQGVYNVTVYKYQAGYSSDLNIPPSIFKDTTMGTATLEAKTGTNNQVILQFSQNIDFTTVDNHPVAAVPDAFRDEALSLYIEQDRMLYGINTNAPVPNANGYINGKLINDSLYLSYKSKLNALVVTYDILGVKK